MKKLKKVYSLILIVCMLLSAVPVSAAEPAETPTELSGSAAPAESVQSISQAAAAAPSTPVAEAVTVLWEDETLRGEYEKHFLMSDGSYQAVVYSYPVHELVNGVWVELPAPEQTARGDVSPGNAQQNILDNFVWEGHGVQDSDGVRLYIGNRSGYECQAYVQFATMPTIPAGATITAATMTLNMVSGTSTANNADAYQVTGAEWTSASLQWSNKPAANIRLEENISHNNKTKYQFSCLAAVQHWYDGDTTGQNENYGIMLCYNNPDIADYNSVYSADCTDANSRPSMVISYTAPSTEITVRLNNTRQLPLPDSEETITWTSNNTAIVTVNSSGVITGVKAGETTVTARAGDTVLATYRVYVIIASGVYYIQNVEAGKYLRTTGGVAENTYTTLGDKQTQGLPQLKQLWRIQYMSSGFYNIRPMYRLTMGLHTASGDASIATLGTSDSLANVGTSFTWKIEGAPGNFKLLHTGSSALALKATPAGNGYISVSTGVYSASNNAFLWSLEGSVSVDNQVLLLDANTGESVTNTQLYLDPGEAKTIAEMNLTTSVVCSYNLDQTITWYSGNSSIRVDNATGTITAMTPGGTASISPKHRFNGIEIGPSYVAHVKAALDSTYYIRSCEFNRYLQVDNNDVSNNYSTSGAIMEQWDFGGGDHQKWRLTWRGGGYYSIISDKSGLALTVEYGQTSTEDCSLLQVAYTGNSRQLWKITVTDNGNYKIKAMSSEGVNKDLVMAVGDSSINDSNGVTIEQRTYTSDEDYKDEWVFANASAFSNYRVANTTFSIKCEGDATLSDEWYPLISDAVASWNNSSVDTNITFTTGTAAISCKVVNSTETWYGLTTSHLDGSVTVSATIEINARTLPQNENVRKSTIAHEIGHLFGLKDNPEAPNGNASLMSYSRNRQLIYFPQELDEYNVKFIYKID